MKQNSTKLFCLFSCFLLFTSIRLIAQTSISGRVWGDANGNGVIDAGENGADPTNAIYVYISEVGGSLVGGTAQMAADGTYTVSLLDGGSFGLRLIMLSSSNPASGPHNPGDAWPGFLNAVLGYRVLGLGGGTINLNGQDPVSYTTSNTDPITNLNIAVDKLPIPIGQTKQVSESKFSTTPANGLTIPGYSGTQLTVANIGAQLGGFDYEDCPLSGGTPCSAGSIFTITSISGNTKLAYGNPGVEISAGTELTNFDPTLLYIYGQNGTGTVAQHLDFTYSMTDKTGITSTDEADFQISSDFPLPIKLVNFQVHQAENNGLLTWTTTFEANSSKFEIEESTDGVQFNKIGEVAAVGNSSTSTNYQYTDLDIARYSVNTIYYRLKETDLDGRYMYSPIVLLKLGDRSTEINVFPNPFHSILSVDLPADVYGTTDLRVFDMSGQQVFYKQYNITKDQANLVVQELANLNKGLYILSVKNNKTVKNIKLMKN